MNLRRGGEEEGRKEGKEEEVEEEKEEEEEEDLFSVCTTKMAFGLLEDSSFTAYINLKNKQRQHFNLLRAYEERVDGEKSVLVD